MSWPPHRPARWHLPCWRVTCSTCHVRETCLAVGLPPFELGLIDRRLVSGRRRVQRGETLYRAGDRFDSLYALWTGFFKTSVSSRDGRDQVTGFQMGGELLGLDGIGTRRHEVDAVALEDAQLCVIPFAEFEALAREVPALQRQLLRVMSHELMRGQRMLLLLGSMSAEERLAAFLLDLAQRLGARGFSPSMLLLRMTREEIASLLGLSIETISRSFSKFQADGLLSVRNRQVCIRNPVGLQRLLDGSTPWSAQRPEPAHPQWVVHVVHAVPAAA